MFLVAVEEGRLKADPPCKCAPVEDHTFVVEGVHGDWKWLESQWRGVRLPYLNAVVKLRRHVAYNGSLPDFDALVPYVLAYRAELRQRYAQILADPNIAPGFHRRFLHDARFNFSALDVALVNGGAGLGAAADDHASGPSGKVYEWGLYLRFLFEPMRFYQFGSLSEDLILFVGENKTLPGRANPGPEEAAGRKLAIVWFTTVAIEAGARIVVPCDDAFEGRLSLQRRSLAEISAAAGFHPPPDPERSARDAEALHFAQVAVRKSLCLPFPISDLNTTAQCNGRQCG